LLSASADALVLEMTLPPFELQEREGPGGIYHEPVLPGWAQTSREGYPRLPFRRWLLQVPASGAMDVQVLEQAVETRADCRIRPAPGRVFTDEGEVQWEYFENDAAYGTDEFHPEDTVVVGPRAFLRDLPVAPLTIHPLRWNPRTRELRVATRVRLIVRFETPFRERGADRTGLSAASAQGTSGPFSKLAEQVVFNYSAPVGAGNRRVASSFSAPSTRAAVRMETSRDGLHRIGYEALAPVMVQGGWDPHSIDPGTFRLVNMGRETAARVVHQGDLFLPGDYIEFYARSLETPYTGTNVYWLHWVEEGGRRITTVQGAVSGGPGIESFPELLHLEENRTLWEAMPGAPEKDYWFWERMTAPFSAQYPLDVPSPVPDQETAMLRVCFRGRTTAAPHPNHHTLLYWNGEKVGDAFWDGDGQYIQEAPIPRGLLRAGLNLLGVELPGDTGAQTDVVYLNRIEISYRRLFEAVEDRLAFSVSGPGPTEVTVTGLSEPGIRILDITDTDDVVEVTGFSVIPEGETYRASFRSVADGPRRYLVQTDGNVGTPGNVTVEGPADPKDTAEGADYLVITPRQFLPAVGPLCRFRESQGLRVRAVAVEDIYDTFGFGIPSPHAIKDFLSHCFFNWAQPAPTYVLLVGDANMDSRDYLGTGKKDRIPARLTCSPGTPIYPDDNWYVAVNGDDELPDMCIGRLSAKSPEMAARQVEKILDYEQAPGYFPRRVLLVADDGEPDFRRLSENLAASLPEDFDVHRVYRGAYTQATDATAAILRAIDEGMLVTHFVGHGHVSYWASRNQGVWERLLESSHVPLLAANERPTFVVAMSCLTGYFAHPSKYSLTEELVAAQGKGAVAALASNGWSYVWENEILSDRVFQGIFHQRQRTLGLVAVGAKVAAFSNGASENLLKAFSLIGDPASSLRTWTVLCGDVTGDGAIDLADAVSALRLLAGGAAGQPSQWEADADGDARVGLEEVVYVLQRVAEMR